MLMDPVCAERVVAANKLTHKRAFIEKYLFIRSVFLLFNPLNRAVKYRFRFPASIKNSPVLTPYYHFTNPTMLFKE
jgi:hypothetical protein